MTTLLAALLALSIPATQEQAAANATEVAKKLDKADARLAEYERRLIDETLVEAEPQIGAEVYSEESPNEHDSFHHARVASVYTAGPADAAGIRPGDRIVAIGPRRLEHETSVVVSLLLKQAPSPVQLTIQRGSEAPIVVSVERTSPTCVTRGVHAVDKAPFLRQLEDIRLASSQMRRILQEEAGNTDILEMADAFTEHFQRMLLKVNADVLKTLHESVVISCGIRAVGP